MVQQISRKLDFVAFNLYLSIGFYDMFRLPLLADDSLGFFPFLSAFIVVLLLLGLPAFAQESVYFMPYRRGGVGKRRFPCPETRRWFQGFEAIALLQMMQLGTAEGQEKMTMAATQLYILASSGGTAMVQPVYAPVCAEYNRRPSIIGGGNRSDQNATAYPNSHQRQHQAPVKSNDEAVWLQPSCATRRISEIACSTLTLFSSPINLALYTGIVLAISVAVYAMLFGRSLPTYSALGRFFVSLVGMCVCTLILHFVGVLETGGINKSLMYHSRLFGNDSVRLGLKLVPSATIGCLHSLGISNYLVTIVGDRASDQVKANYVSLSVLICFFDTLFMFAFAAVNALRTSAVKSVCRGVDIDAFMSLPGMSAELRHRASFHSGMLMRYVTTLAESVLMFGETSGFKPWTVYLPFNVLVMLLSILLMCMPMLLFDLLFSRLFGERRWSTVALLAVLRFGLLLLSNYLKFTGYLRNLSKYMFISALFIFFLVKLVECVSVHLGKGFAFYIRERRRLIPAKNAVQLFLFDWYLAPAAVYLYNFGYPLMCGLVVLTYRSLLCPAFWGYFIVINVIPVLIILLVANCR